MTYSIRTLLGVAAAGAVALTSLLTLPQAYAHGNVTPQGVDTTGLPKVGDKWLEQNPYRGNKLALTVGTSAYNQNCARCHGIEAISGGIAPDLRQLDRDCFGIKNETKKQACYKETDNYFLATIRHGKYAMAPCTCRRSRACSTRKPCGPSRPTWKPAASPIKPN